MLNLVVAIKRLCSSETVNKSKHDLDSNGRVRAYEGLEVPNVRSCGGQSPEEL